MDVESKTVSFWLFVGLSTNDKEEHTYMPQVQRSNLSLKERSQEVPVSHTHVPMLPGTLIVWDEFPQV